MPLPCDENCHITFLAPVAFYAYVCFFLKPFPLSCILTKNIPCYGVLDEMTEWMPFHGMADLLMHSETRLLQHHIGDKRHALKQEGIWKSLRCLEHVTIPPAEYPSAEPERGRRYP